MILFSALSFFATACSDTPTRSNQVVATGDVPGPDGGRALEVDGQSPLPRTENPIGDGGPNPTVPPPLPELGIGYVRSSDVSNRAAFYDPVAKTSTILSPVDVGALSISEGGKHFVWATEGASSSKIFAGYVGKSGAEKEVYTLVPKTPFLRAPKVAIDADGRVYYWAETETLGYIDLFRDGIRVSQGPGRATKSSFTSLESAAGGSVAWTLGDRGDNRLFVSFSGQSPEETLEMDGNKGAPISFSPNGLCIQFPAKITTPNAKVGMGIRCRGTATTIPSTTANLTVSRTSFQDKSLVWHPSNDRLAVIDGGQTASNTVYVASRVGATWGLDAVALPPGMVGGSTLAVSPDGSRLYVVSAAGNQVSAEKRLLVGAFAASGSVLAPVDMGPVPGSISSIFGFGRVDGKLGVVRYIPGPPGSASPNGTSEVLVVAPSGSVQSMFTTTDSISEASWSPDGERIAVRTRKGTYLPPLFDDLVLDVFVIPRTGGPAKKVTPAGLRAQAMRWAGSGQYLALRVGDKPEKGSLVVVDVTNTLPPDQVANDVTRFLGSE